MRTKQPGGLLGPCACSTQGAELVCICTLYRKALFPTYVLRIGPILYKTVILDDTRKTHTAKSTFQLFVANLDYRRPEFYSTHVKNLWISATGDLNDFKRILTICSGVENLLLPSMGHVIPASWTKDPAIELVEHLNASSSRLRRMTALGPHSPWPNFEYACFANITHLHLHGCDDWSRLKGFELLHSLTHLAVEWCRPEQLALAMLKLPAVKYVAICKYETHEYGHPMANRRVPIEMHGINVVLVDGVTIVDWERGANGGADFWDVVEKEVALRRAKV